MEAQTASAVAAQPPQSGVLFYDEVSLEFILRSIPKNITQDLRQLVFADCREEEKTELLQTVRLYFDYGGNIKRCAEASFIHRNTFQYRMDRLKKKTGYDLRVPKDSVLLYLATYTEPEGCILR